MKFYLQKFSVLTAFYLDNFPTKLCKKIIFFNEIKKECLIKTNIINYMNKSVNLVVKEVLKLKYIIIKIYIQGNPYPN